jgi:DNA repair exonuclease SbcCD ATPase subunit
MIIKSLKLTNLGLFKEAIINPDKINLIKGINLDNPNQSSNGSGKSSIFKNSLLFSLYGEGCGKTLNRLISFGQKKCIVEVELEHRGEHYRIIREVPNKLQIFVNDKEKEFNTASIGQVYLNNLFGDYTFFRKYCLIDARGINLLDSLDDTRSIISFKKELMQFIDTEFAPIRESLLKQKNDRELYSKDKRLYHFYLSDKKLLILNNGLVKLEKEQETLNCDIKEQTKIVNDLKIKINSNDLERQSLYQQQKTNENYIAKNKDIMQSYANKVNDLSKKPFIVKFAPINYDQQITDKENEIKEIETSISKVIDYLKNLDIEEKEATITIHDIDTDYDNNTREIMKLQKEIEGLNDVKIGTKCDRCGSLVTEEHKAGYKKERYSHIDDINNKQKALKEKKLNTEEKLNIAIKKRNDINENKKEIDTIISDKRNEIKELNNFKYEQNEKQKAIETEQASRQAEIDKFTELKNTYQKQINDYEEKNKSIPQQIEQLSDEIEQAQESLITEESCLKHYNELLINLQKHIQKTKENIMKLKEAFKFIEYKYGASDIQLYSDSIKTLDQFSGYFISEWLQNLNIIINDLLKNINLSVQLTEEKEFIRIKDGDKDLNYADLSSGQQVFFSCIFKLAILLQKGESDRIIIMDDGLGAMDESNFKNLIEICQTLPMQFFVVFQDTPQLDNVNYIEIERKEGISYVK